MKEQAFQREQSIFSRIGYIRYPTTDFDKSVDWYTNILGFHLRAILDQGASHSKEEREAVFNFGNTQSPHNVAFLLVETKNMTPIELSRNGKPFTCLTMNCLDIEYSHKTLKERGVEVGEITGSHEAKSFFFKDPDGNVIEAAWSIWD